MVTGTKESGEAANTPNTVPPGEVFGRSAAEVGPSPTGPVVPAPPHPRNRLELSLGLLLYVLLMGTGALLGGVPGVFARAGLPLLPFGAVALLAHLGLRHRWAHITAWALTLLMHVFFSLFVLSLVGGPPPPPGEPLTPVQGTAILVLLGDLGLCLLLLIPELRRALARLIPIDAENRLHTLALFLTVGLSIQLLVPLATAGEIPLARIARDPSFFEPSTVDPRLEMLFGLVWLIPLAFVAAGFGIRRGWAETIERLGLVGSSRRRLLIAAAVGLALVPAFMLFDLAVTSLFEAVGLPITDTTALEALLRDVMNPLGIALMALSAGVGEELVVRGLLQPRLGIWLSNLLFAAMHAFQYHWDALVGVFALGLVIGLVRKRSNTVVCMIAHGVYDLILLVLAACQGPGG